VSAVLFDDAEGEHADSLSLVDGLDEVGSGEFFPFCRECRLRNSVAREGQDKESDDEKTANRLHTSPRNLNHANLTPHMNPRRLLQNNGSKVRRFHSQKRTARIL
jgi:hypothetical protein